MQPVSFLSVALISFLIVSCSSPEASYVPKPKGYNRIALPAPAYQPLPATYPYSFEYSRHATILPDTFALAEPNWIFVYYPRFKANIQITYKRVQNDPRRLKDYIDDAYKLSGKHHIRASSIQAQTLVSQSGRTTTLFRLEGDVPSPFQFYTTDSTTHFLRGAIYFPTATKNDSLAPVIEYLQKDMMQLLNTLSWRK
ncbi:hypothetical protein GCM10027275_23800 [Rhabdobacter roseus]|uniref:Gliding motility-associated lipoprotein GldD n=1 Tax=Rhabdobacter roseus TaxID=1655419 RepID=A0A840TWJ6_9BACT|nr:gliding motility lipoprotein GldD [Rhabdobacter roseus]MBB5284320.1 gliding motility-associated lipoprotein GldD [Rhabdobacter roseus]